MLIRTIYVNRASSPMPLELKDILAVSPKEQSCAGHQRRHVFSGWRVPAVSGRRGRVVDALYQKIEKDSRHSDVKMLVHEPIAQREYP